MKVTKISAVTLPISDMKKSVDFYSKIPNFKIVFGGPDSQFTSFLIEDGEKSYLNLKLDEARLPNFGRIIFYTDDVDELFAYMENDETISGLAGVGDLYVSAAGGRNSKMGSYLGKGLTFKSAKKRFMLNDTVEGEQLAREIAPFVFRKINKKKIPLMIQLLKAILNNKKFKIN